MPCITDDTELSCKKKQNLSYPCYLTQAVTCGLYIGCIGTHAHGRQVTSLLCYSDINIFRISAYSGTSGSLFQCVFYSEQEKESICVRMGLKNLPLTISLCHHSASLVMPIGDPQDRFFYPTLTLMMDSFTLSIVIGVLVLILFLPFMTLVVCFHPV